MVDHFENGRMKALNAIKGWKHAGSDLMKARSEKNMAGMEFVVTALKKDGTPSKMRDPMPQLNRFRDEQGALNRVKDLKRMNPGTRWAINGKEV